MTNPSDPSGTPGSGSYSSYPSNYSGYPSNYPASDYPASRPGRLRGKRAIQVGGGLIALGIILAIVGGVLANTSAYNKVNSFQRVSVQQGTGTVTFDRAGGYVAYYESSSVRDSKNDTIYLIPGTLTHQTTGTVVQLDTPYGNRSDNKIKYVFYNHDGHKGHAMWQFHISEPGTYDVRLDHVPAAPADAVVAFGKSIAGGIVVAGVLVIIGVLALIAGLITLIVGLVRRRRHKRDLSATGYGGPGAFGGGQPAGWPQQSGSWPQQSQQSGGWPQHSQPPGSWPQQSQQPGGWPQQSQPSSGWPQHSQQPGGGTWPQPDGDAQSGWPPPPDQPPDRPNP